MKHIRSSPVQIHRSILLRLFSIVFIGGVIGILLFSGRHEGGTAPIGFGIHPLLMFGALLLGFWIVHRTAFRQKHVARPAARQRLHAAIIILGIVAVEYLISRVIPPSLSPSWVPRDNAYWVGVAVSKSILMTLVFLPLPVAFRLVFPAAFLSAFRRWIMLLLGLILFYVWASTLQFVFHHQVSQALLTVIAAILSIFPGVITLSPEQYTLTYSGSTVFVSASCLGMNSTFLFVAGACVLWLSCSEQGKCDNIRALAALVAGVLILQPLNAIRIALIAVAGAHFPPLVAQLFHRSLGVSFLTLLFLVYLAMVLPRTGRPSKRS